MAHGYVGSFGKKSPVTALGISFAVCTSSVLLLCPNCPGFAFLSLLYNTHNRQTSRPSAGFAPATPASDRRQTLALDRSATGIGMVIDPATLRLVAQCLNHYATPVSSEHRVWTFKWTDLFFSPNFMYRILKENNNINTILYFFYRQFYTPCSFQT